MAFSGWPPALGHVRLSFLQAFHGFQLIPSRRATSPSGRTRVLTCAPADGLPVVSLWAAAGGFLFGYRVSPQLGEDQGAELGGDVKFCEDPPTCRPERLHRLCSCPLLPDPLGFGVWLFCPVFSPATRRWALTLPVGPGFRGLGEGSWL